MRKLRFPLLLLAVLLSLTLSVPKASAGPTCEIYCWGTGTFGEPICWQDRACQVHCCEDDTMGCPGNPCYY